MWPNLIFGRWKRKTIIRYGEPTTFTITRNKQDSLATESSTPAVSQSIQLTANAPLIHSQAWRTRGALLIAVALHVILLALPSPLLQDHAARNTTLRLTITQLPEPGPTPVPQAEVGEPAPLGSAPTPPSPARRMDSADTKQRPTKPAESIQRQQEADISHRDKPVSSQQPIEMHPLEGGARSRSTVFDPRLAAKLSHERNQVQKFLSGNTELMTANGTFIRKGDYCAEIRRLIPSDIDSNVSQHFRIKCTKRRRPQEDIDRLAREYGIP